MEKVILLNKIPQDIGRITKTYARIYYGSEFCDFLTPTLSEIRRLKQIKKMHRLPFSLVTPYVNERNLKQWLELLDHLNNRYPGTEVIANDWGIIHAIKNKFRRLPIVLGRLLTKQKKGFFYMNGSGRPVKAPAMNKREREFLNSSILQNRFICDFLADMKIRRLGLDNIPAPSRCFISEDFKIDLYYPYIYLTTSNYCLSYIAQKRCARFTKPVRCPAYCKKENNVKKIGICDEYIYLKGNTQFRFNDNINMVFKKNDRLVYFLI